MPGWYGSTTCAGSVPCDCAQVSTPSPGRRQATAEYGVAAAAHPVETTVATTASVWVTERANWHGGGGGRGPFGLAWAGATPTIAATTAIPTTSLPMTQCYAPDGGRGAIQPIALGPLVFATNSCSGRPVVP